MDLYAVLEATVISESEAWAITAAVDHQLRTDLARSGWRSDVRCLYLPGGAKAVIPRGGSVLHYLDNADQQGVLGYHDEDGKEVPYARVFLQTAQQAGDAPSEVASHEALELAVDPHVNLSALTGDGSRLYAYEVADAVQGNPYSVGSANIAVADFVLPGWFDPNTPVTESTSFKGSVKGPFTLASQGYASYVDLSNVSVGWQNQFGQERSELPPWKHRVDRLTTVG
jgi:hypothetical protein